jgi:dienelactone hydrolase
VVLIPTLVNREDRWSGSEVVHRFTNQPHREWIHRQAFEVGRTLIGYELQKILAAVDKLSRNAAALGVRQDAIGVAGYGEGGLLALHCAALEPRIRAAMVSGYFQSRDRLFEEPIYRNVFGLLRNFSAAQLAALVAPRRLIIEGSLPPEVSGPPAPRAGRRGAAPGVIPQVNRQAISAETTVARELTASFGANEAISLVPDGDILLEQPGSSEAIGHLLSALGVRPERGASHRVARLPPASSEDADARQRRTVRELEGFTQALVHDLERARAATFWSRVKPGEEWQAVQQSTREQFWANVIGKIPQERFLPLSPRSRVVREHAQWIAHEVRLDVLPDVFAWGWLLVPRDIQPGERRPVVVCQHGLEGLPEDVANDDPKSEAFGYYKAFAARLAERGFIVYAPHNPYRGGDKFRALQRRANPLGLSLFSFIVAQHDAATRWLATLPFVDPERIAFYGLSYGGKTAMRVPAVLDRYCLSICSGDFNEWVRKNVSTEAPYSYMFTGEWEMPEWNLAGVANYSEMAMLMAPRPFMVERGHDDGVGVDEWVAYEYAKVRRGYVKLGIGDRTEIEWFDGPHTIHGVGTFEFLHKHLHWPKRP